MVILTRNIQYFLENVFISATYIIFVNEYHYKRLLNFLVETYYLFL